MYGKSHHLAEDIWHIHNLLVKSKTVTYDIYVVWKFLAFFKGQYWIFGIIVLKFCRYNIYCKSYHLARYHGIYTTCWWSPRLWLMTFGNIWLFWGNIEYLAKVWQIMAISLCSMAKVIILQVTSWNIHNLLTKCKTVSYGSWQFLTFCGEYLILGKIVSNFGNFSMYSKSHHRGGHHDIHTTCWWSPRLWVMKFGNFKLFGWVLKIC